MVHLSTLGFFAFNSITIVSSLEQQSSSHSNPDVFPIDASQPIPGSLSSRIADHYFPSIMLEPGDLAENLPPRHGASGNTPVTGHRVGTSLYGFEGCTKKGFSKTTINDAYYDLWKLTNRAGIMKGIDWNSAAALEFLGAPANNQAYQAKIQDLYSRAASVIYSPENQFVHYIHVRCDDPMNMCNQQCKPSKDDTNSNESGDLIAYTLQEDPDDGYSMINFCPPFFKMRRLRTFLNHGNERSPPLKYWLSGYDNTARVFLHELFHLDYFMHVDGANHVTDLSISFHPTNDEDLTKLTIPTEKAYGTINTKIMARFQETINPVSEPVGLHVARNADSLAWYAVAKYVQDKIGTYPHLPIVYSKIEGPPFKDIEALHNGCSDDLTMRMKKNSGTNTPKDSGHGK